MKGTGVEKTTVHLHPQYAWDRRWYCRNRPHASFRVDERSAETIETQLVHFESRQGACGGLARKHRERVRVGVLHCRETSAGSETRHGRPRSYELFSLCPLWGRLILVGVPRQVRWVVELKAVQARGSN